MRVFERIRPVHVGVGMLMGTLLAFCTSSSTREKSAAAEVDAAPQDDGAIPETSEAASGCGSQGGPVDADVAAMFDDYAPSLIDNTAGAKNAAYYGPFLHIGQPDGDVVIPNDAAFANNLNVQADDLRNRLGMTSVRIVSMCQIALYKHHLLVRTLWGCTFQKTGDRVVPFPLSFIVSKAGPKPKIFMHLVEIDEPKKFRELGLIP